MMLALKPALKQLAGSKSFLGRVVLFLLTARARIIHSVRYHRAQRTARIGFLHEHGRGGLQKGFHAPAALNTEPRAGITYMTKCWEGDWRYVLNSRLLKKAIGMNNYQFAERILMINNVLDQARVRDQAERLVRSGILTRYFFADDYAREVLDYFSLSQESFKGGYRYSICELAGIYICTTRFLLHYSSDTCLQNRTDWIREGLRAIEKENAKVVNPAWNGRFHEARAESMRETDQFFVGYGFSDHCYLIRTADFKAPIYGTSHPASERYPAYGGELFEKKVDSWMRTNGWLRFTHKKAYYLHYNHFKKPA